MKTNLTLIEQVLETIYRLFSGPLGIIVILLILAALSPFLSLFR